MGENMRAETLAASKIAAWPEFYLSQKIHQLDLDSGTLSEILRLYLLSSGAETKKVVEKDSDDISDVESLTDQISGQNGILNGTTQTNGHYNGSLDISVNGHLENLNLNGSLSNGKTSTNGHLTPKMNGHTQNGHLTPKSNIMESNPLTPNPDNTCNEISENHHLNVQDEDEENQPINLDVDVAHQFCIDHPEILSALEQQSIFELSIKQKLQLLNALINILCYQNQNIIAELMENQYALETSVKEAKFAELKRTADYRRKRVKIENNLRNAQNEVFKETKGLPVLVQSNIKRIESEQGIKLEDINLTSRRSQADLLAEEEEKEDKPEN